MKRIVAFITPVVVALLGACGNQATALCDLKCECEHCSDLTEEAVCVSVEVDMEVAEAYDCLSEWEEWATCVEEKGRCEEKEARFTTQEPGSCNGEQDTGFACAGESDCDGVTGENTFCSGGTCKYKACSDGSPCTDDSDCHSGKDACADEREKVRDCQAKASGHESPNDDEPQPGNGPTGGAD